jgi:hypothetical protein
MQRYNVVHGPGIEYPLLLNLYLEAQRLALAFVFGGGLSTPQRYNLLYSTLLYAHARTSLHFTSLYFTLLPYGGEETEEKESSDVSAHRRTLGSELVSVIIISTQSRDNVQK